MISTKTMYWIVKQAPAGNWVGSLGIGRPMTLIEATKELESWAKSFPNESWGLMVQTEVVLAAIPASAKPHGGKAEGLAQSKQDDSIPHPGWRP